MSTLVLPILWPLMTALVLALINGRFRLEKAVAVLSTLGLTAWVFWLLYFVDQTESGIVATVIGGARAMFR
jgi:multicomponent Na+:H+ antiporter subunit D